MLNDFCSEELSWGKIMDGTSDYSFYEIVDNRMIYYLNLLIFMMFSQVLACN